MLIVLLAAGCGNSGNSEEPPESSSSSTGSGTVPGPEASAPAATDDRPIILAFGDSLTAGSGLAAGSGYPEMLQAELDKRGYRYRVVNAGVGGDTTGAALARLQSGLNLDPEIVVLELGGNDGLRGLPLESMQANLEEMIVAFQKGGARVILAGMTLPRNFGPEYIGAFEKVYPTLANKYKVTLIPFFLEGAAGKPELNLEDGIHPNQEGYRYVTQNVLKALEPMLKK